MSSHDKINCWDYLHCNYGPDSEHPCPTAVDGTSDGVNNGGNAGRICWTITDTLCFHQPMGRFAEKKKICYSCGFFHRVRKEEGSSFHLFKLAQGIKKQRELRTTISQIENLIDIHGRLHSDFDLNKTLMEITAEARKTTGAQRSVVFLLKGDPPALHGEFTLRGEKSKVVIPIDDNSAVGYAVSHNHVVNLRNIYGLRNVPRGSKYFHSPIFNKSFDKHCNCETHSLLAIPVQNSEKRVIGVITVANSKKGFFSADDEWFMSTYAIEVALAIEKQRFLQQSYAALRLSSIGETVAGLSHCIKNIAQALRGSSYIIRKAIESNNVRDIKVAWEILDKHIESLANLSLDVLTYEPAAPQKGKEIGLNDMIHHVIKLFQEEARARAITLKMRLGKSVDPCKFDAQAIYRCLVNLINNAFDACPLSEGVVTLSTKRTGAKEVMMKVADNGRGIDENVKLELFDLFKTSKPGKGVGLGLPTVADIVKRHNGRIEVDTKPGGGTAFKIYIQELP
ncbi:ATP-binding protein [Candidatus Latescibacterota bacterium]